MTYVKPSPMIKYVSLLLMLLMTCCGLEAQTATNILLRVRMQWSTNGVDWLENQVDFDSWDDLPVGGTNDNAFFVSNLTNDWGFSGPYEAVTMDNIWGPSLDSITNHSLYSTIYIIPSRDVCPNIIYRPCLSLTNYP